MAGVWCHIHLFIRGEWNPKYDQTVLMIVQKHGIDTVCLHIAKDLFKNMTKDSSLQGKMTFLHQAIPIFNGPLKHSTWINDIRMNVQEKFEIRIVQMMFSPELCSCDSYKLKQKEKGTTPWYISWNHNSLYLCNLWTAPHFIFSDYLKEKMFLMVSLWMIIWDWRFVYSVHPFSMEKNFLVYHLICCHL